MKIQFSIKRCVVLCCVANTVPLCGSSNYKRLIFLARFRLFMCNMWSGNIIVLLVCVHVSGNDSMWIGVRLRSKNSHLWRSIRNFIHFLPIQFVLFNSAAAVIWATLTRSMSFHMECTWLGLWSTILKLKAVSRHIIWMD